MNGRKILYPRDFGWITAGSANTTHVGVNYNNIRINGYVYGAHGVPNGLSTNPDDCVFPNVTTEGEFGREIKTKFRVPIMTGALGSTFIAARYWESFAIGAALVGYPIVVGENVVGVDKESEIKNGKITKAPELDRRIETFLRYYDGYGAIIVQMNVEDTRNGVAEYIADKYGDKVIMELKWGQGAKVIGGEIQVTDLEYAKFLHGRGYIVDPDPTKPEVQEGFKSGAIKSFARHSRLGYTDMPSIEDVTKSFNDSVAYLRKLGFKRITLKTGSYGMETLALSIKLATDNKLDLLTIDGSGGGTGMSPWNMMESWGIPSIHLHSKAYEYAKILADKGEDVVDLSFAGGLVKEDQIFKALALGAPYAKLVCMGRSLMIPGYLGSNIEGALHPERKEKVNGHWESLPKTVLENGIRVDDIFAGYYDLQKKIGKDEMEKIPYGAIASWTLADKLAAGLQQLLAGARKFSLSELTRNEVYSANRETEEVTGVPFMCDVENDSAMKILKG